MNNNNLFSSAYQQLVNQYLEEPRNKIHVNIQLLTLSAIIESGSAHEQSEINGIIEKYLNGDLNDDETDIYDGAVAVCGSLARECFGGDPDEDVDYEITWLEDASSSYYAEVRPA